jgi:hypothetical protein
VDNISIAWPKKRFNRESSPQAELVEGGNEDRKEGYVQWLKKVNSSVYSSAHTILDVDTKYTIIAVGLMEYLDIVHGTL